ncbi:SAM-dependent methyltransferase [Actinomadura rudentiformis]|uniref:Class I SAM-dependent methyltransferase n=1 Tax=Actinomadura rudentiformis TaxID=359158 RepID=A0A6H9YHJ9_9ACTN|nr:class I SAM-dependent methyltransferase [Actinomadura rudentiformis]KAB2340125.1 class I SAM-dependent methyltransferase [Actinomadura rudentiformis]
MATPEPALRTRIDALITDAWVLAALAAAIRDPSLSEEHGAVLGAAGYAEHTPDGWRLHPACRTFLDGLPAPDAFAGQVAGILRQAADAADGRPAEEDDDASFIVQGESSGERMTEFLDLVAARVPEVGKVLHRPGLRFLDIGTGIGAIAATVISRAPAARAVGIDIAPRALRLAEDHLIRRGVRDRVDLRLQDVAELADTAAYDLAWLPLGVLAPHATAQALPRILAALRPGGWLISATVLAGTDQPGSVREAVLRWRMARRAITPWTPAELAARLTATGFHSVTQIATPQNAMGLVAAQA